VCRQKERAHRGHERRCAGRKSGPTAGMSGSVLAEPMACSLLLLSGARLGIMQLFTTLPAVPT